MFKKKGFTIIELLIVIAVIGILVGIALPRFKGMQDEGNIARARAELRTIQTAVESYYSHHASAYPADIGDTLTNASPQILAAVPTDPFKPGVADGYKLNTVASGGVSSYYVISSVGPDGVAGITGIDGTGAIQGTPGDDIYVSNGTSSSGG